MRKKLTKIIATISDINCSKEFIESLYLSGMDGVRLNTAHTTPDKALEVIKIVRQVSDKIPIMIDTKEPEVRTKDVETPIPVKTGDTVSLFGPDIKQPDGPGFQVNYDRFISEMNENREILLDDGELSFSVIKKEPQRLILRVNNDGIIQNKKVSMFRRFR